MPTRKKDNPTVKVYKNRQAFDPEYDVHILDGSVEAVALYGVKPMRVGQEAVVMCSSSTKTVTIASPTGVVFGTASDQLTFDANDNVLLRAVSLTKWLIIVNNGVVAN